MDRSRGRSRATSTSAEDGPDVAGRRGFERRRRATCPDRSSPHRPLPAGRDRLEVPGILPQPRPRAGAEKPGPRRCSIWLRISDASGEQQRRLDLIERPADVVEAFEQWKDELLHVLDSDGYQPAGLAGSFRELRLGPRAPLVERAARPAAVPADIRSRPPPGARPALPGRHRRRQRAGARGSAFGNVVECSSKLAAIGPPVDLLLELGARPPRTGDGGPLRVLLRDCLVDVAADPPRPS